MFHFRKYGKFSSYAKFFLLYTFEISVLAEVAVQDKYFVTDQSGLSTNHICVET